MDRNVGNNIGNSENIYCNSLTEEHDSVGKEFLESECKPLDINIHNYLIF